MMLAALAGGSRISPNSRDHVMVVLTGTSSGKPSKTIMFSQLELPQPTFSHLKHHSIRCEQEIAKTLVSPT